MPLTQHELELKKVAVERITQRRLPAQVPKTIWAGQGSGERCSLCDRVIDKTETEFELDMPPAGPAASLVRFHLRCHALWQLELARLADQPPGISW